MKMTDIKNTVAVIVCATVTLFLPLTVHNVYDQGRAVFFAKDYKRIKVLIDSLEIEDAVYSDGTSSLPYYVAHSHSLGLRLSLVIDNKEGLITGGGPNMQEHFYNYMETHNDSVWIWYHPNAKPRYAGPGDMGLPGRREVVFLFINLLLVLVGFYSIFWQARCTFRKKKDDPSAP